MSSFYQPSTGRGFSLIEALLSLALVALVLGLTANTVTEYTNLRRATSGQDAVFEVMTNLGRVTTEVQGAVVMVSPPPGSTNIVTELIFDRFAAGPGRLPDPLTGEVVWQVKDPTDIQRVRYFVTQDQLFRQVNSLAPVAVSQTGLLGFSAQNQPDNNLLLNLTIDQGRSLKVLERRVFLPLWRAP